MLASHDHGVALQTDAVLFSVVTVRLLAAWWCLFFSSPLVKSYEIPLTTHGRSPASLREGCEEEEEEAALSNELLPSQPRRPLPPPLLLSTAVAPDQLTSGPHAAGAECRSSCWTRRPRQAGGCYCDVRRAFKRPSPRGASLDDWLSSLTAWHNRLPSRHNAVKLPLSSRPSVALFLLFLVSRCSRSRRRTRALSLFTTASSRLCDS